MEVFYQNHNSNYFSKMTANNCYPLHLHREVELFYCKYGPLNVTINQKEYHLSAGDLIICFPNNVHSIETPEKSLAFLCIFSTEFLGSYEKELLEFHPTNALILQSQLSSECTYLLTQLEKQLSIPCDLRICRGYLTALIGLLLPQYDLQKNQTTNTPDTYKLILDYIHKNFTNELTLTSLSKDLGLSKYYVSHIFSYKIGMSFSAYVNRVRVDYAVQLLDNPELQVTDICYRCGFNSTRTFYRAFQEIYHTTPLQLRHSQ